MTTLDVALGLIGDLDRNDADAVGARFAPGATWWVDTGVDRASGVFGVDPGDDRPWPLHGATDAVAKAAMLRGLPSRFPAGCRQHVRRSFAGGDLAVIEVEGDGLYRGERHYQNRYAFVIQVELDMVTDLREYLDTAHAAATFDGKHLDRRTSAPRVEPPQITPLTVAGGVVVRFIDRLSVADGAGILAVCASDATWWADGGKHRTAGPEAEVETEPRNPAKGKVPISLRAGVVHHLPALFPGGLELVVHRLIEADDASTSGLVAAEVQGYGRHVSGALYQNRYCFVFDVKNELVTGVREYCDTQHGFDVLSGRAG